MASRQCMLTMKLKDIEREKFDGSLAKRQIHQYFPPSINCVIRYMIGSSLARPMECLSIGDCCAYSFIILCRCKGYNELYDM